MRLSQRADYAMRMMVDAACMSSDQRMTIGKIAQRQDVSESFMAKIATQAAAAGLVVTQRGTGGGLVLSQPADTITMLQIVEAIDGPLAFNRCTVEPSLCPRFNKCAVHLIWEKAQQQFKELLSNTLLSEIAQAQSGIDG
ncbi:MAG: Rrf2 family transcriptional regulator [Chloroflexi bacterium]|nr:Rrf2 family transcriptional regulator [Chloroflexota bacterium]